MAVGNKFGRPRKLSDYQRVALMVSNNSVAGSAPASIDGASDLSGMREEQRSPTIIRRIAAIGMRSAAALSKVCASPATMDCPTKSSPSILRFGSTVCQLILGIPAMRSSKERPNS
jgi:hypothetical protein